MTDTQPQLQATLQIPSCADNADILISASNYGGGSEATIFKANVALTPNGTIDVTQEHYVDNADVTVNYSNVPVTNNSVVGGDAHLAISQRFLYDASTAAAPAGSTATHVYSSPQIPGATTVTSSAAWTGNAYERLIQWSPASATTNVDFASALQAFAAPPELDVPNRQVAWQSSSQGAPPDATLALVFFVRNELHPGEVRWHWSLAGSGADHIAFPVLPPAYAMFNPVDLGRSEVYATKWAVPGGYTTVRTNELSTDAFVPDLSSSNGMIRSTQYFAPL